MSSAELRKIKKNNITLAPLRSTQTNVLNSALRDRVKEDVTESNNHLLSQQYIFLTSSKLGITFRSILFQSAA